jgi:hypothetical protein
MAEGETMVRRGFFAGATAWLLVTPVVAAPSFPVIDLGTLWPFAISNDDTMAGSLVAPEPVPADGLRPRFLWRPQLLTRSFPLSAGRDIAPPFECSHPLDLPSRADIVKEELPWIARVRSPQENIVN